ncbi:Trypanosomal VSG domain containing protein, putative [Trypanosoma equiperdum]|uniref:Trypanosomal VSG domain containing protein, putative n=1 Tax=Trypanosoma equiperdum TaxID=5694 RepID=A0A1G4I023_TRYEQ|nr:Trypanosomal VSG domain containing protein, putative [Trypanosoma equiperdum]
MRRLNHLLYQKLRTSKVVKDNARNLLQITRTVSLQGKAITSLVFLLAVYPTGTPAIQDGDNADAFAAICHIMQLQEAGAPEDVTPVDATAEISELKALNMSLSPQEWQQKLLKAGDQKVKWDDDENTDKKAHEEWKTSWDNWAGAKQLLTKQGGVSEKIKDSEIYKLQDQPESSHKNESQTF